MTAAGLLITSNLAGQQVPGSSAQPSATTGASKTQTGKSNTTPSSTPAKRGGSSEPAPGVSSLTTAKQKESYALGMNIAEDLKKKVQTSDIDNASLVRGLRDALAGNKPLLTVDEAVAALAQLQKTVQSEEDAALQNTSETNIKEGEAFFAANKTKEGVVTLPSGLQYKILTEGTGPKPAATDTVVCHYRGTLLNGKEFDSSYKRGQPASFPLNQVIKGWTEGVQLMPVGSKWQFFIPPSLAYGTRGAGADIGPNATLIFEVELISIQGK